VLRIVLGVLFVAYGLLLLAVELAHDDLRPLPLFFLMFSVPMFTNRLGSFGRYFLPVFLGLGAYELAGSYSTRFRLHVHYMPQIDVDKHLGPGGELPTVWLQQHLYDGRTGPLEVMAVVAYAGHFVVPFAVGAALILLRRTETFSLLMFAILIAGVTAMVIFVVAPTAPPWLAAQDGYVHGVHHILKRALYDVHMSSLAAAEGNASKYDVTAAFPSLHTTFPLICFLAGRRGRLPRPALVVLALNFCAVIFSIVYTGEHYVVDVLAGVLLAIAAWSLVTKVDAITARRRNGFSMYRSRRLVWCQAVGPAPPVGRAPVLLSRGAGRGRVQPPALAVEQHDADGRGSALE
jgi:membrane-associated phospholipid phosphatase